jgi:uncharacterized protein (DUF1810 family)
MENPMTADPWNLERFVQAQDRVLDAVAAELAACRKRTHWMWFVFPQLAGLGSSAMAQAYALSGLDEARAYLAHPLLGPRLVGWCEALLHCPPGDPHAILGWPDDQKLHASMTLFARASGNAAPFVSVLRHLYHGRPHERTEALLAAGDAAPP